MSRIHLLACTSLRPSGEERVVARKLIERTILTHFFVRRRGLDLLDAGMAWAAVSADIQAAVGIIHALVARAGVNGAFQAVLVRPALEVVSVESVALRVPHGPDQAVRILDGACVVEELVKYRQDRLGVALGAYAKVVVANGREGNLALRC